MLLVGCVNDAIANGGSDTSMNINNNTTHEQCYAQPNYSSESDIIADVIENGQYSTIDLIKEKSIDYILVTNADNTIEHTKIREGSEFLGLTLEEIIISTALFKNDEFLQSFDVAAQFSGEMILNGSLIIFDNIALGEVTSTFTVDKAYLFSVPRPVNNDLVVDGHIGMSFNIATDRVLEMLGYDLNEISEILDRDLWEPDFDDWFWKEFNNLTIRVENFMMIFVHTNIISFADIVEIVCMTIHFPCLDKNTVDNNFAGNEEGLFQVDYIYATNSTTKDRFL